LVENDAERFTQAPLRLLANRLRSFVAALSLPITDDLVGEATDDTE